MTHDGSRGPPGLCRTEPPCTSAPPRRAPPAPRTLPPFDGAPEGCRRPDPDGGDVHLAVGSEPVSDGFLASGDRDACGGDHGAVIPRRWRSRTGLWPRVHLRDGVGQQQVGLVGIGVVLVLADVERRGLRREGEAGMVADRPSGSVPSNWGMGVQAGPIAFRCAPREGRFPTVSNRGRDTNLVRRRS